MNPGQESVDEYFAANYPPCREELDAFKADLRAEVDRRRVQAWHEFRELAEVRGSVEKKAAMGGRAWAFQEVLDLLGGSGA